MDATNIYLTNFYYQGGDDCVAIKPQSYGIYVKNATCHGGNGMAIGSLGQYLDDATVENVLMDDVKIETFNDDMEFAAYIKTWVGKLINQTSYESDYQPRGGGWGSVRNVLFSNFLVHGAGNGPTITQDSGDDGTAPGSSLMEVSNIVGLFSSLLGLVCRLTPFRPSSTSPGTSAGRKSTTGRQTSAAQVSFSDCAQKSEADSVPLDVHPCYNIAVSSRTCGQFN